MKYDDLANNIWWEIDPDLERLTIEELAEHFRSEFLLGPAEMQEKYEDDDDWGHHPLFPRHIWKNEIADDNVFSGY